MMKRILLVAIAAFATGCADTTDLTGTWVRVDAEGRRLVLVLEERGGAVTGWLPGEDGSVPVTGGYAFPAVELQWEIIFERLPGEPPGAGRTTFIGNLETENLMVGRMWGAYCEFVGDCEDPQGTGTLWMFRREVP